MTQTLAVDVYVNGVKRYRSEFRSEGNPPSLSFLCHLARINHRDNGGLESAVVTVEPVPVHALATT